jgi:hypothetical protein
VPRAAASSRSCSGAERGAHPSPSAPRDSTPPAQHRRVDLLELDARRALDPRTTPDCRTASDRGIHQPTDAPPKGRTMCARVTCQNCGKPTWEGCGEHIEQALAGVAPADRCSC